ncbi:MAG: hypothetical protein AAGC99_17750, partial [Pseudomonadota bacterium]
MVEVLQIEGLIIGFVVQRFLRIAGFGHAIVIQFDLFNHLMPAQPDRRRRQMFSTPLAMWIKASARWLLLGAFLHQLREETQIPGIIRTGARPALVAVALMALALTGCQQYWRESGVWDIGEHQGLLLDVSNYYHRHAKEEGGRCISPYIDDIPDPALSPILLTSGQRHRHEGDGDKCWACAGADNSG